MRVSRRETVDRYYLLKWRGFGIFLHRIHHSDDPFTFHDHPWPWVSFILGQYREDKPHQPSRQRRWFNVLSSAIPHRVTLTHGPVWTLFVHGRRNHRWSVFDQNGMLLEQEPWRGVEKPERTSYRS